MALPNILFSSTVQWNVGDEFILQGIRNALHDAGVSYNALLFNRNPAVSTPWNPTFAWPRPPVVPPENSFQLDDDRVVDYVIFAGSPEWSGGLRSGRVHRHILQHNLRCSFLGVGLGGSETLGPDAAAVVQRHTDLFVARDTFAATTATPHITPHRESCPAILASRHARPRGSCQRVGLVIQDSRTLWQSVPAQVRDYLVEQYRRVAESFETVLIAHYLDDLKLAQRLGLDCRYSYDSRDFHAFFEPCDVVISPRVHGCGLAASMGIPSILIAHDGRAETGEGFGSLVVPPDRDLVALLRGEDWAARSAEVIRLKASAQQFYVSQLRAIPSYHRR